MNIPNIRAPMHMNQTLTVLKGEIASSAIVVGDFNTSLAVRDRTKGQRWINK